VQKYQQHVLFHRQKLLWHWLIYNTEHMQKHLDKLLHMQFHSQNSYERVSVVFLGVYLDIDDSGYAYYKDPKSFSTRGTEEVVEDTGGISDGISGPIFNMPGCPLYVNIT
jgi:hypothetical protein